MNSNLPDLLAKLEDNKTRDILFHKKEYYNYAAYLKQDEVKFFYMVAKNFFVDSKEQNNRKIDTIRYWFLHNLFILMEREVEERNLQLINKWDNVEEIVMLQNYFNTTSLQKNVENTTYIFLPRMTMFSLWVNMPNNQKMEVHKQLFLQMLYLDDHYFAIIHYLKAHDKKFLEKIFKKDLDEKGNNVFMHLIRTANFKNSDQCFRNFKKIWNYFHTMFGNRFLHEIKRKNIKGARPIHYLSFINRKCYKLILSSITVNFKTFMESYFWQLVRNLNRYSQLEAIVEKVCLIDDKPFLEKMQNYKNLFQQLFERILENKYIPYLEKYNIIFNLDQWSLIKYDESHKEKMGKKLWITLNNDKKNIMLD